MATAKRGRKKTPPPKVFDVARNHPATASSRPLIITNHPIITDPMVKSDNKEDGDMDGHTEDPMLQPDLESTTNSETTTESTQSAPLLPPSARRVTITPSSESTKIKITPPTENQADKQPDKPSPDNKQLEEPTTPEINEHQIKVSINPVKEVAAKTDQLSPNQPSLDQAPADQASVGQAPVNQPESNQKPTAETEVEDSEADQPKIDQTKDNRSKADLSSAAESEADDRQLPPEPTGKDQPTDEELKAEAERQAKLKSEVDSQEYFLPIKTEEQRRSHRAIVVGLLVILLLAVAWMDLALDAGLISNPGNLPHTHLFNTK